MEDGVSMIDSVYWIWFQLVFGIGGRRAELMLNYFAHPLAIYEDLQKTGSRLQKMLTPEELTRARDAMTEAVRLKERTLKKGCAIVTPDHEDYPEMLRDIYARPAVLYVKGDIACLRDCVCIGIVGSRKASEYGVLAARKLAGELAASGVVVVSGLANGIDSAAHDAALQAGGKTVGFMGCGLDVDYPKGSADLKRAICQNGAVVTEFPLGFEPKAFHFPIRNRLVSGVSHGIVVVEAGENSGALITAALAGEQGRDVYAVPGDIFSDNHRGVHALLKDGVKPVDCAADILVEYPALLQLPPMPEKPLTLFDAEEAQLPAISLPVPKTTKTKEETQTAEPKAKKAKAKAPIERKSLPEGVSEEAAALYALIGAQPVTVEELTARSQLTVSGILSALTELEIYGLIQIHPGRTFSLAA